MIFRRVFPPQKHEMAALVKLIHKRLSRFFIKKGYLEEDHSLSDGTSDPLAEQNPLLAQCIAASVQNRIALGDRAGQKIRKFMVHPLEVTHPVSQCAQMRGFSLPFRVIDKVSGRFGQKLVNSYSQSSFLEN